MKNWRGLALGLMLLTGGCKLNWMHTYQLTAKLTNDANNLLTVEGQTNLPTGAPLEAVLRDGKGHQLARADTAVEDQGYYAIMDISHVPGALPLTLEVSFDPTEANNQVVRRTGSRGESMAGPQVQEWHHHKRLIVREKLVLQMSTQESALRRIEQTEGGIREMEAYLERHPHDADAMLKLGLARIKVRPKEGHPGSQAQALLQRALQLNPTNQQFVSEGRLWLSRMSAETDRLEAEKHKPPPPDPYKLNHTVKPGQALGEIKLGMLVRHLGRHVGMEQTLAGRVIDTFKLKDFHDVEITADSLSGKVTSIRTRSKFFRFDNGLGVGSLLQEVQARIPGLAVAFEAPEKRADGNLYSMGKALLEGVTLTIERKLAPGSPLPLDQVVELEIVPPQGGGQPTMENTPTPSLELTPAEQLVPTPEPSPSAGPGQGR